MKEGLPGARKHRKEEEMIRALIVDDENSAADLVKCLSEGGCHAVAMHTYAEALTFFKREMMDIVILGTKLPGGDGIETLAKMKALRPLVQVIMVIGWGCVDDVVRSMKLGAYDCLTKPIKAYEFVGMVNKAYEAKRLAERRMPCSSPGSDTIHREFVGKSDEIMEVKRLVSLVGPSNAPVLILGETGTGKELVARAIHEASSRSRGPFVTINSSALPEHILESELFGHKRGAFTDAQSDKAGLLEIADQGTFFIDEVGDMDPIIQAKLLRVIETGTFRKIGDTREIKVDVRFVSATNKDLEEEIREKTFRVDLFYRLSTFIIEIPPLRDRRQDIPLLIDFFLSKIANGGVKKRLSPEVCDLLRDFHWPGNVRELANVIERACLLSPGDVEVGVDKLPLDTLKHKFAHTLSAHQMVGGRSVLLQDAEREYIQQILAATEGNKSRAARLLGISRTKLYSRLADWQKTYSKPDPGPGYLVGEGFNG